MFEFLVETHTASETTNVTANGESPSRRVTGRDAISQQRGERHEQQRPCISDGSRAATVGPCPAGSVVVRRRRRN